MKDHVIKTIVDELDGSLKIQKHEEALLITVEERIHTGRSELASVYVDGQRANELKSIIDEFLEGLK